jgi:hypothetical protein
MVSLEPDRQRGISLASPFGALTKLEERTLGGMQKVILEKG